MSADRAMTLLADASLRQYPAEAAVHLERMRPREVSAVLERVQPLVAADVLRRLRGDRAAHIAAALAEPAASRLLGAMEPMTAAAILARLDDAQRESRLERLQPALSRELRELMAYPAGVAGSIMNPRVPGFRGEVTAREALSQLRASRAHVSDIFIVDSDGKLAGSVSLQELALAETGTRLEDIMTLAPARVQALAPHDELTAIAEDRRVSSLAVVDVSDRLLGVISYAELLAATQRDASADLQTMVGVSREERALSDAWFAVRKRLPWLQINLATAFLAASVVAIFEGTIARFTALAVLLPVVAGQSGNTGAQALAVTMRGLALREIRVRHWFRVARKELVAGAVNGVAVALVTAAGVLVWSRSLGIAAVIGVSMVCSMIVAGVAGASVPMALILLKQDPAASSSIVLTTLTDIMGFLTFLGFATLAAGML
jgi:magnesium transporter